ncbi:tRNA (adenosine(37)-N6)-dimethylallyltransferase MiaA [Evansella cellulosilytica]|uniref:tRNA dimethylallyltransferase n=1 Tax=Evansella cellulosilytica (strain ATCC 21833 / DSM 2522 / FERM P-1141 / JCM 9156 / N-4) TaxID=649639 RepID=E6TS16_EVAC2|nr:tRNA (adenosine(37)-N6)-dimethylallyltransferase MiaA [Evansella cellulosilytica]ADU30670.1 tRNA delta(2)-isopentenylpyrophosphate transferase [Evansella cellulosilytica DSM 2522]
MGNLVVIVGPTAVGKTATGIALAKGFNGEIISGDSMQIYRGMDVGTAKITDEEMEDIPHYLIDIKDPKESFSVAEFQELAKGCIKKVQGKGKLPLIVGGTGLYVNAVIYDYDFSSSEGDSNFRNRLERFAQEHGNEALHEQLKHVDPQSFKELHPNNIRRIIRALEIFHVTGKTIHDRPQQPKQSPYNVVVVGLTMEREKLYSRINERVDNMVTGGLIEEAEALYKAGVVDCQSVQAIGYKEIYQYIEGNLSKEEAIDLLKRNSRRYAKRQLTWFRNKMDITWFDMTNEKEKKLQEIKQFIEGKLF